jgi:hypothetical protein
VEEQEKIREVKQEDESQKIRVKNKEKLLGFIHDLCTYYNLSIVTYN